MPKGDLIELEGVVEESMGGGQYKVRCSNGGKEDSMVRAQLSGRMKSNHIRVLPGDRVKVGVSPYDLTHGLITFRGR